jgi:hypothetical protein
VPKPASLVQLVRLNVVLHIAGLGLAAATMRAGTPLVPLAERLAHLGGSAVGWRIGWCVWMLCALALVALFARARSLVPMGPSALAVVAIGAAIDLVCDAVQLAVLPHLARTDALRFLVFERWAGLGGTVAANGLYAVGTLLLAIATTRTSGRRMPIVLGGATFLAGVGLALAGAIGEPRAIAWTSGITILAYCGFVLTLPAALERSR